MNDNARATDDGTGRVHHPARVSPDDELVERITRALRSREAGAPDAALVAARVEARLAAPAGGGAGDGIGQPSSVAAFRRRGGRVVVAGLVTSTLAVGGAGAAAAADPYSEVARAVENVAQAVGIDWTAMPEGYTREQYDAFWGAGHTPEDVAALSALWSTDLTETKARAGQMILDGLPLPVPPGLVPEGETGVVPEPTSAEDLARAAFWEAGYTPEDVAMLDALWSSESMETKARAGQMILDGEEVPVAPGEAPTAPAPARPGGERVPEVPAPAVPGDR